MVNGCVWDKIPCLLNQTEEVNEWLTRQLALCDRRYTACVLSRTRVMSRLQEHFRRVRRADKAWEDEKHYKGERVKG